MLNNTNFKPHIYEGFKNESAKPHFWMSSQKWINEQMPQKERLIKLNKIAIQQMTILEDVDERTLLK